jgi:DNA (cytosine-5)-methyltransferase 3A
MVTEKIESPIQIDTLFENNAQAGRVYAIDGKSVTLNANGGGMGGKTGLYLTSDFSEKEYTVRKLTPIECERLQTVSDNYTEGVSNTQRYKMLGNGWTVDVITHILTNIKGIK